MQTFINVYFRT